MPTLTSLPSDAACAVSAMLNAQDLLRLALASKSLVDSPFHYVCFRRVLLLFVPPDGSHQAWFRQRSLPLPRALPSMVSIGSVCHLAALSRIASLVEVLFIGNPRHFRTEKDTTLPALDAFVNLKRLELIRVTSAYTITVDVRLLAQGVPQLEELIARHAILSNCGSFRQLLQLRRLVLVDSILDSLDFTLVRLAHLELDQVDSDVLPTFLRQLRPLKTLRLDRVWPPDIPDELALAIEQTHSNTLESLSFHELCPYQHCELHPTSALRDLSIAAANVVGGLETVGSLGNLRSLDINPSWTAGCLYTPLNDLTPLSSLVNLEVLTVAVSRDAVTCTPLRRLTKLRKLTIENAWLRDFIAYLPLLESLECYEDEYKPLGRSFAVRTDEHPGFQPDRSIVRVASIGPTVQLNVYAFALLANVRSLTVDTKQQPTHYLRKISKLKWATMLRFTYSGTDPMETQRTGKLACVARIERLEFWITCLFSEQRFCPWNLAGAARLRVLIISRAAQSVLNAIVRWRYSLVSLQELYLAYFQGNSIRPLLLLSQLRAVEIGNKLDCSVLREAARPEQALPLLTRVVHSDGQCSGDVCRYGKYGVMYGRG